MKRISILLLPLVILFASNVQAQNTRAARELVKRGIARFSRGDIDGAIANYEKAMEISPKLAEAFLYRGKARRAKGDLNGAIEDYETSIEIDPQLANNNGDIANAYYNRGFIHTNSLQLSEALSDFDRAISCKPRYTDAYLKRGEARLILGQLESASSDFDMSLALDPRPYLASLAYAGRGFAKFLQGDEVAAAADFEKSIELNSEGKFFLELHLRLLEAQMKEVDRRRREVPARIAESQTLRNRHALLLAALS
jgi:tetratricopeptide (TPR) repeat protein